MARSKIARKTAPVVENGDLPPASAAFRPLASRSTSGSWLVTFARRGRRQPEYWLKARKAVRAVPPSRRKSEQLSAELEYRTAVAVRRYFEQFPEASSSIPRPVLFLEDCDGILTEYRGGRHLKDALFSSGNLIAAGLRPDALVEVAAACGRWLRLLHEMPVPDWLPRHPVGRQDLRSRAEEAVSLLRPEVRRLVPMAKLLSWIDELDEDNARLAVSHGDFQPGNVLLSNKGISVIDLGTAGARPPEDDLGFFITFTCSYKERVAFGNAAGTRAFINHFCGAFLRGYGAGAETRARVRPFVAWLVVQRLADMSMRIERWSPFPRSVLRSRLVSWVRTELPLFLREFD